MWLKNKKNSIIFIIFILAQLVLYYFTLFVGGKIGNTASFIIVALSFLYSLLFLDFKHLKFITQVALLFTMFADVYLVLLLPQTERTRSIAMTFFTVTQIAYYIRILQEQSNKKINAVNTVLRICLTILIVLVTILVIKDKTNYLAIISVIYYANLFINLVFAFINVKKSPLVAIGLLLFMLCDTIIGLQVMDGSFLPINNEFISKILYSGFNTAWVFYAPSQVLLSISAKNQPSLK